MKTANPYLNFNGNTEEAFTFYKSVFGETVQRALGGRPCQDAPAEDRVG